MNDNAQGSSWGGMDYFKIFCCAVAVTIYAGLPGTNSRTMNTVDPMNESETCKVGYCLLRIEYKLYYLG